ARRRQWLIAQGLGKSDVAGIFQPHARMLDHLRQRDLEQASHFVSRELGLAHSHLVEGERIVGTFSRSIDLASGKYAVSVRRSTRLGPGMDRPGNSTAAILRCD
ncbi:MAG: DUF3363 domain-containing protein, partial [Nitrospira sp.]